MLCFLNHSWQRCQCILIYFSHSNLFLDQFSIWSLAILLEKWKIQEFCLISHANAVFESLNQESARRVYLNITREKPTHTPDTPDVQPLLCKLEWTNQKFFYCFLLKPIRDNLAPGIPRALDLSPRHVQKSSGLRLGSRAEKRPCTGWGSVVSHFNSLISEKYGWETVAIFVY